MIFFFAYFELVGGIFIFVAPNIAASFIQDEFSGNLAFTGYLGLIVGSFRVIMGILNLKNQKYAAIIILGLGLIAMLNGTNHLPIGLMDYIFGAILTLLSGYTIYNSFLKREI